MKDAIGIIFIVIAVVLFLGIGKSIASEDTPVYPGSDWVVKTPAEVSMDVSKLKAISDFSGGFGCVVRHGYMVYTWGDPSQRMDVASAVKPWYVHFVIKALEEGKIGSLDEPILRFEPRLESLNPDLNHKDRAITWRYMCNQISCYGVREEPGKAYDYSDYNMALLFDTLFLKVYGVTWDTVDRDVLHPQLTDLLECQDNPTFLAFGDDRPGRLKISMRDFARFGLLYLRQGRWKDRQLIRADSVKMLVTSPLPNSIPRCQGEAAEMIPGQRSIGGGSNQTDHIGSYSFAWWINGIDREGKRHWPGAPADTYGCFGHGGLRAMVVMPDLDLIIGWNDTQIDSRDKEDRVLTLLKESVAVMNK